MAKSDGNCSVLMNRSQPKRRRSRAARFAYSPNVSTTGDSRTGVVGGVTWVGASLLMRWTFGAIGVRKWAQVKVDVSPCRTVRAVMISLSDLQYSLLIAPSLQRSKHGYDFGGA